MQGLSNTQSSLCFQVRSFLVLRLEFPAAGDSTSETVTASTEPQDQGGSSQRWAGGTSAATPKTIPCPGSPSAAAVPVSSLSTSPTQSNSDELRRQGHQVKGLQSQVKFLVVALAFLRWAPRSLGKLIAFPFLNKWWMVIGWEFSVLSLYIPKEYRLFPPLSLSILT